MSGQTNSQLIIIDFDNRWRWRNEKPLPVSIGLGLQGLYSATNCADNILGHFTIIHQNQIARVDSFTNLIKRWVFRFRLNASISSHNLFFLWQPIPCQRPIYCECTLAESIMLEFGDLQDTFFIGSYGISFAFWWGDHFLAVGWYLVSECIHTSLA